MKTILTIILLVLPLHIFAADVELDYMEYASDAAAQAAYVTSNSLLIQSYSEATIKTQGSYSLKGVAQLLSTGATLTKTIASPIDLSGKSFLKFDIRSSRTGGNIKLGIRHNDLTSSNKLLANFDGADGATTYTASTGQAATFNGNAQLDTALKYFGTASLLLDGTGDYLSFPDEAGWTLGSTFTIDWWMYLSTKAPDTGVMNHYQDSDNFWNIELEGASGNNIYFLHKDGGTLRHTFAVPHGITTGGWHHFALVNNGGTYYWFVDGSQVGTSTDADLVANNTGVLEIGRFRQAAGYLNGQIDELRIDVGLARWTANFTPFSRAYGTVTTEKTHTISSADTFETDTWDISGVANADKSAIDRIIATDVDASLVTTFYIDNFYGTTSSIKSINGLSKASVKSVDGLAIASVKSWNGLQ